MNLHRRASFLHEMGIKVQWQSRARLAELAAQAAVNLPVVEETPPIVAVPTFVEPTKLATVKASPPPAALATAPKIATPAPIKALIHKPAKTDSAWDDEPSSAQPAPTSHAPAQLDSSDKPDRLALIAQMDWIQLERAVSQCTACALSKKRTQAVFGVGDKQAQWLLIGEGPGRTEDAVGEPFVGKSGKLLDNMLASLQLQRGQNVYIANIVKCRPSDVNGNDRPPSEQEASACRPFLERQIALLQPRLMLALGRTAAVSLLQVDSETAVGSLRGKVQQVPAPSLNTPVVVTYHPAYLLRKPIDKAKAWADLCLAQQTYESARR